MNLNIKIKKNMLFYLLFCMDVEFVLTLTKEQGLRESESSMMILRRMSGPKRVEVA
jgi:hypothetical protein